MIATESQGVFLQFLAWLAEHPAELKAHALLNGQNSWFKDRSPFPVQSCAIISTAWIYQQYLTWKRITGAKNPSKYDNVWGEQKALTLFMRQALLSEHVARALDISSIAQQAPKACVVAPAGELCCRRRSLGASRVRTQRAASLSTSWSSRMAATRSSPASPLPLPRVGLHCPVHPIRLLCGLLSA
jgi:hypothetical protein